MEHTISNLLEKVSCDKSLNVEEEIFHYDEVVNLIPSNIELSGMEVVPANTMSRETVLRTYLNEIKRQYDYILIDCSPSLGMITLNTLTAADKVIIPVQANFLPVKGLEQLLKTVNKVKRQLNPKLQIGGILLTMVEGRSNFSKDIGRLLRENYGNKIKVYTTEIPRGIKAAETSAEGKSIYAFDGKGKTAKAYEQFTKKVLENEKQCQKDTAHQL